MTSKSFGTATCKYIEKPKKQSKLCNDQIHLLSNWPNHHINESTQLSSLQPAQQLLNVSHFFPQIKIKVKIKIKIAIALSPRISCCPTCRLRRQHRQPLQSITRSPSFTQPTLNVAPFRKLNDFFFFKYFYLYFLSTKFVFISLTNLHSRRKSAV